jgi:hypothetical protein
MCRIGSGQRMPPPPFAVRWLVSLWPRWWFVSEADAGFEVSVVTSHVIKLSSAAPRPSG